MTNQLLNMCDHHVGEEVKTLSMQKQFPALFKLGRSDLIIPLQESLTASLPPTSSLESDYQPFPPSAPTFEEFFDEIEVMRSLAKPRKITIRGSNGQIYMFLGKPKDDLRKDARLMDFNAIINKLLKANSESRRRQLHIRTYGVVTLNEECGFIQWVPNTIPLRPVLMKGYDARRIKSWSSEMNDVFRRIKDASDKDAAELFRSKILSSFPPVFHDWFIETFPEPSAWLASRLAYGRTAAVMSMVGFILGLGDRHCENILLDVNTGDVVHVDFNCLFEKGKTLETPERVPFRLTQNIVDGLGVTGVEGVFRLACEVTLQLLRDNKDSLMSVLDAFIHDPLVEWEDEKRKLEREPSRRNAVKASVDLRMLGKNALNPIERKLKGLYMAASSKERAADKEVSTGNLVQMLIQEATDMANLAKMYPGWASWH
ncbi:kinase-like domain-containing protein [Mycena leptocephala]|nr:kinase-like domain-containing protein [Mycena leptocephala]